MTISNVPGAVVQGFLDNARQRAAHEPRLDILLMVGLLLDGSDRMCNFNNVNFMTLLCYPNANGITTTFFVEADVNGQQDVVFAASIDPDGITYGEFSRGSWMAHLEAWYNLHRLEYGMLALADGTGA